MNHEMQIAALRKKHNDAVGELSDQLEQLQKLKAKTDKDKAQLLRDVEDAHANADAESRARQEFEKQSKLVEMQFAELQTKADEQVRMRKKYFSDHLIYFEKNSREENFENCRKKK